MKHSTKTTVRTTIQAVVSLAAALPLLIDAAGIPETVPGVAVALAVAAGLTRVMALPTVQQWLDRIGLGTDVPEPPDVDVRLVPRVDEAELDRVSAAVRDRAQGGASEVR